MTQDEEIYAEWRKSINTLHRLFRVERLYELKGRRLTPLDVGGMHPQSLMAGQIYILQTLFPEVCAPPFDWRELRMEARIEAENEYLTERFKDFDLA